MSDRLPPHVKALRDMDHYFTDYQSLHNAWIVGFSFEDFTAVNKAQLHMRIHGKVFSPLTVLEAYEEYETVKSEIRRAYGR